MPACLCQVIMTRRIFPNQFFAVFSGYMQCFVFPCKKNIFQFANRKIRENNSFFYSNGKGEQEMYLSKVNNPDIRNYAVCTEQVYIVVNRKLRVVSTKNLN